MGVKESQGQATLGLPWQASCNHSGLGPQETLRVCYIMATLAGQFVGAIPEVCLGYTRSCDKLCQSYLDDLAGAVVGTDSDCSELGAITKQALDFGSS